MHSASSQKRQVQLCHCLRSFPSKNLSRVSCSSETMALTEVINDRVIYMERTNFFTEYSNNSKADKSALFKRRLKAEGSNARIALQPRCGWLQWFEVTMFLSHICQSTPFYLKFDNVSQRYAISTSTKRKVSTILSIPVLTETNS